MDPTQAPGGFINFMLAALPASGFLSTLLKMLLALFSIGTVAGCVSKQQSIQEQRQVLEMMTDFARENNVTMVGQAGYNGRTGLYQESAIGVSTGLTAQGTFIFQPNQSNDSGPSVPPVGKQ